METDVSLKKLKIIGSIFKNVIQNPNESKFKRLNIKRLSTKLGHSSSSYFNWLYNAGFYTSKDDKYLIFDDKHSIALKAIHSRLIKTMQIFSSFDESSSVMYIYLEICHQITITSEI